MVLEAAGSIPVTRPIFSHEFSVMLFIIFFIAYLLGSVPFGLILSRIVCGIDIRTVGSGNIGTTNVLRTGNKFLALATLILDGGKGALAVSLPVFLKIPVSPYDLSGIALLSILGHIFPIWLRFKGGKGVATAIGATLALHPFLGVILLVTWGIVAKITRTSSLSAILAFITLPLGAWFIAPQFFIVCTIISIIIVGTHRDNILRILNRQESSF